MSRRNQTHRTLLKATAVLLLLWIEAGDGFFATVPPHVFKTRLSSTLTNSEETLAPQTAPFFETLAENVAQCLVKSELKRDSGFDGASTGWTSWVEDSSALQLQSCMDTLCLAIPVRLQEWKYLKKLVSFTYVMCCI